MIFTLLIIHNHDSMSSTTRVLHTTTWDYFISHLPDRFRRSPLAVKEAIMTDINDLVQEFWRTSSDVEPSFFAMRRLLEILQRCLEVCFDIISVFVTAADLTYRSRTPGSIPPIRTLTTKSDPNLRNYLMAIEKYLISHFLNPTIWVMCSDCYLVL